MILTCSPPRHMLGIFRSLQMFTCKHIRCGDNSRTVIYIRVLHNLQLPFICAMISMALSSITHCRLTRCNWTLHIQFQIMIFRIKLNVPCWTEITYICFKISLLLFFHVWLCDHTVLIQSHVSVRRLLFELTQCDQRNLGPMIINNNIIKILHKGQIYQEQRSVANRSSNP